MRDASTGEYRPDESASLAAAATDADDNAEASPQARDEDEFLISSEEFTEEPSTTDLKAWVEEFRENPLIRVPTKLFVSDVVEPGYEVEVASRDPTVDSESFDEPVVPESYPNATYHGLDLSAALERWLSRSVIVGNSFDRDFRVILEQLLTDAIGRRGTGLAEHVYDDPETRRRLLGLRAFSVEDVTSYTREGKAILLRPDDTAAGLREDADTPAIEADNAPTVSLSDDERLEIPTTRAGKAAAFVQFDDIYGVEEREEIAFALDDVTMLANDPDTGEVFGRPDSATVAARSKALRSQLEDLDQGLKNAAWNNLIVNVDSDNKESAKEALAGLDPNSPESISVTNTNPEVSEINGEVPDVVEHIQQQVEYIVSAMRVPLYRVGFEGNINRDVTSEQSPDYRGQVARARRWVEAACRRILELKANEFLCGHAHPADAEEDELYGDPADVPDTKLHVRPDGDTNPFQSDHFDAQAFNNLTTGLKNAAPGGEVGQIITPEALLGLIPGLDPEEAMPDAAQEAAEMDDLPPLDEADPDVQDAFAEFTGRGDTTDEDDADAVDNTDDLVGPVEPEA